MKPLVYYCRWQGVVLRLRGREETAVWGQLVFTTPTGEETLNFRFNLQTYELTVDTAQGTKLLRLDEMGVVIS